MDKKRQVKHEKAFFSQPKTVEDVLVAAEKLSKAGGRIYGVVLSTRVPLEQRLHLLTEGWGRLKGFKVTGDSGAAHLIEVRRRAEDGHQLEPSRAYMWQEKGTDACYFLTCQPRREFDFLFDLVHSYLQPHVCRLYIRTPQIEDILKSAVADEKQVRIRIRQYVARSENRINGKRIDTTVQYTSEDFSAMFRDLQEKRMWLSLVRFSDRATY